MGLVSSALGLFSEVKKTILDSQFPDENLLTVKGLDIEHASVPTWDVVWY